MFEGPFQTTGKGCQSRFDKRISSDFKFDKGPDCRTKIVLKGGVIVYFRARCYGCQEENERYYIAENKEGNAQFCIPSNSQKLPFCPLNIGGVLKKGCRLPQK